MRTKIQLTNRILSFALTLVMVLSMLPMSALTAFAADGAPCAEPDCTGTYKDGICTYTPTHYEQPTETTDVYDLDGDDIKDTVYEIANEGQLRWFAAKVNAGRVSLNAVLTTDITFTTKWTPIGNFNYRYSGFFDGQNYTVDFAFYSSASQDYSGLFGYSTGSIKNVKVYNFVGNYGNYNYVAAVVGYNKGTISNCVNLGVTNGTMFNAGSYGGGIAGQNDGGTIENCTSYIPVYCNSNSGGIAGDNESGTIKNCTNYGKITAYTQNHGGIVGENYQGTVENCVNYGEFDNGGNTSYVGGIAGSNRGTMENCTNYAYVCADTLLGGIAGSNEGQITYCQNDGKVNATNSQGYQGGIVGRNAGTISACFNSGEISGVSTDGNVGGIAGYSNNIIENCANTGYINQTFAGAIVGNNGGSIHSCYNYGELKAGAYGVVNWNDGSLSNVYYKNGNIFYYNATNDTATKMTDEQFASGEVAYLLNNKVSDGTQVWYQNIDNGKTADAYPVLDNTSGTVYRKCNGASYIYSNSDEGIVHNFTGECDTICDICEYTREVSVDHIEGTPANCNHGAICQTCGSEYGEKSGDHDVNEETAVCRNCNHQFDLKYLPLGQTTPLYTDNANTALDACIGRGNQGVSGGTVTLFANVTYSGNFKSQVQGCTSTIVLNGHTLTLSGKGMELWSTKITIDGTNGGTLDCTNGSPIIWEDSTVKIIGNPSYKQNGNEVALKFTGLNSHTPTLDLTEYTGSGFTFSQSYRASITVNLPDKYMLVNADTGETITSADVVSGVKAKVVYNHTHDWEYTVSGDTITAICGNGSTCPDAEQSITISAVGKTYDGTPVTATLTGSIGGVDDPEIVYSGNTDAGSYTASITIEGKTASVEFTIAKAAIANVSLDVTAPEAGAVPQNTVTAGTGYSAEIAWNETVEKFGFNTAYTATVTLTADSNHKFADNLNVDGWNVAHNNDNTVATLTKTFDATRKQKIESVTVISNVNLDMHKADANAVIATLPTTVSVALEENGTDELAIVWSCENFNTAPLSENTFTWTATNDKYDGNNIELSGTITVKNPAANDVTITVKTENTSVVYNEADVDLTSLFEIDANADSATYTVTNGTGAGTQNGNKLTVTKAGTFEVRVDTAASGIYAAGTQTATLTVNKANGTGTVSMEGWTYGETAKEPVISNNKGAATYQYKARGADDSTYSSDKPSNAGEYTVKATFAETDLYNEATATADFTIAKATPAPNAEKVTTARVRRGQTLADAIVTNGEFFAVDGTTVLEGTFAWVDDTKKITADSTEKMKFTPIDTNYAEIEFDVAVDSYTTGGGGGGSSNITTTTTKNEDGSTTKVTENKATGTKTEVTTNTDGSTTTVETKKDGTVTTTEKDKDGNTTTTVEKPDGTTTTEEIKKDGTTVKTETTASGETTAEVDAKGETEVVIPVPDAEDVYEVVVTDEKGNETVITDFEVVDGGVAITVDGNAFVSLSKGSKKEFVDVHPVDHWSEESVDYVYIRGLMKGTSENHFSPDATLTRAMLVTVLYRLEGEPKVSGITSFADLEKGQYYLDAVCWAQVNGIVNGTTDTTFAPNDNITREQIAAIMHRYAQYKGYDVSVGENTNILSYDDIDNISEYAIASMKYAVGSGLMKGKTTSTLNPLDNATRAEAAAILERFIKAN